MNNWNLLSVSEIGNRARNEDKISHFIRMVNCKTPVFAFIACDGVGGVSGGGEAAEIVATTVEKKLKALISKYGTLLFSNKYGAILRSKLKKLRIKNGICGATTMVALIFCTRRLQGRYRCIAIWAGDSRAHIIDGSGHYLQLTHDHHDDEGRLTSAYVAKDGFCKANIEINNYIMNNLPLAFGVSTDGLHGKCRVDELRHFLSCCLVNKEIDSETFASWVQSFLEANISDNYSAIFLLRKTMLPLGILENNIKMSGDINA
ncbi:MAG: protein phosphatase 2C domain-containing protein [Desulfuromonadaceae bacterium]|nr:protein phosphatase 2C domain-containing protein [Desulfuromonadaceae bacterium]